MYCIVLYTYVHTYSVYYVRDVITHVHSAHPSTHCVPIRFDYFVFYIIHNVRNTVTYNARDLCIYEPRVTYYSVVRAKSLKDFEAHVFRIRSCAENPKGEYKTKVGCYIYIYIIRSRPSEKPGCRKTQKHVGKTCNRSASDKWI